MLNCVCFHEHCCQLGYRGQRYRRREYAPVEYEKSATGAITGPPPRSAQAKPAGTAPGINRLSFAVRSENVTVAGERGPPASLRDRTRSPSGLLAKDDGRVTIVVRRIGPFDCDIQPRDQFTYLAKQGLHVPGPDDQDGDLNRPVSAMTIDSRDLKSVLTQPLGVLRFRPWRNDLHDTVPARHSLLDHHSGERTGGEVARVCMESQRV